MSTKTGFEMELARNGSVLIFYDNIIMRSMRTFNRACIQEIDRRGGSSAIGVFDELTVTGDICYTCDLFNDGEGGYITLVIRVRPPIDVDKNDFTVVFMQISSSFYIDGYGHTSLFTVYLPWPEDLPWSGIGDWNKISSVMKRSLTVLPL